ncbi:ead/Ea22-like family protein [Enterobacter sp. 198]|uniref:ead/Ea22-like family protein n=1 Tax=Enterobacter sp. 198 TaxID=1640346 RepID=UPI00125E369D|nr:ead/Ea22-like family protein [Enterobacter sp. 198]KAB5475418.1 ead/Ea22-like family protein [Enterobacter sp. 198]
MSNIDKRALREAAEKASTDNHTQDEWFHYLRCSTPETVLALLDEMEAKDKLSAELMEKQRLIDICQGQGLEHRIAAEKRAEAAEKKTVEMPTFDGYVPHVARELQAAFRIACDNAGINIAAAGKGEAS